MTTAVRCPRCRARLRADEQDRDAGWCLVHGTVYVTPPPQPERERKSVDALTARQRQVYMALKWGIDYRVPEVARRVGLGVDATASVLSHLREYGLTESRAVRRGSAHYNLWRIREGA